ncbi:SdrD B-like domain-containing protein [Frigoribacterium sp. RIT-PI-h]|uniref:SdrD B-like domain-containing protein n=1 Tax=Frigoribacterium sp. RIT-PI-h TaxID=1690245 RepID=UPI0006B88842|nr:SdrD B-like domain-containing protein [Frigoribacterium sp. RIT-PI-h]
MPPSFPWRRRATALAVMTTVLASGAVSASADPTLSDADLTLSIESSEDGHGPFTPGADTPGADSSANNGRVRTADAVTWSVQLGARSGRADDVVLELDSVSGSVFSERPDQCGAGSRVTPEHLTCRIGSLERGILAIPVVTRVPQTAPANSIAAIAGQLVAAGSAPVPATSDDIVVSAAPRWDLSASTVVPVFSETVGPDGLTPGFRIVYPVLLHGDGLQPEQGPLGLESLGGSISFVDDVSRMYGSNRSPAVLSPLDDAPACGINTGQITGAPGGRGGGTDAVVDSGEFTCTQSGPGEPVTVSIAGIDSSLTSVPTRSVSGTPITGGVKPYVVSGYMSLWVPRPATGDSFTARNVYRDLAAPSVSGQTNYLDGAEPASNNVVDRNVGEFAGVQGSQRYFGAEQGTATTWNASGKYDQPYVTPGQDLVIRGTLRNAGTTTWSGTKLCTVFDRDVQSLRQVGANWAVSSDRAATGRPAFAAFGADDPSALRDAECGPGDDWYDDPTDVPGGPEAVGKVVWSFDHPGDATIGFNVFVSLHDDLPDLQRVRSFTSVQRVTGAAWVHDRNPADEANGGWADFLTMTSDLARVTTKVVDPGHDAEDTPDATRFARAGETVTLAVYPTVTNATGNGLPGDLLVTDLLPPGASYVEGSSSHRPETIVDESGADGVVQQRITWRFPAVHPNDALPAVTFDIVLGAAVGPVVSTASVVWDRDVSDDPRKQATRGLHVLAGAGFSVGETVDGERHVLGDEVTFTLRYQNLAPTDMSSSALVTVLPHDDDGRKTVVGTRVELVGPVAAVSSGEEVRYTTAAASSVPNDPDDDGTTWCVADLFGSVGCPSSWAEVTAVRIDTDDAVAPSQIVRHDLVVRVAEGGARDAVLASDFTLRTPSISTALSSQVVSTTFVSGSIGDQVWADVDGDGLQGDEPGVADLRLVLTGVDDRGDDVDRETTTDAEGRYTFEALRPGTYLLDAGAAGRVWTAAHQGDDSRRDSDVDEEGRATISIDRVDDDTGTLVGVTSTSDVDAGLIPDPPVTDPPVTEPPADGDQGDSGDTETPGDAGPVDTSDTGSGSTPARLAFTGTSAALLAGGLALGLALLTLGVLTIRRRRLEK